MMFDLSDLLQVVGPTASLVFAAWIFLSYLQSRFGAAFERYRALAEEYRHSGDDKRKSVVRGQVKLYKRRCELMRTATQIGVVSAILLLATLIVGAFSVMLPSELWSWIGGTTAVVGLLLVVIAAIQVLRENGLIRHAVAAEVKDLADFENR